MAHSLGSVSVWVGTFDDEEAFQDYVDLRYPPAEAGISPFLHDVPIGPYDDDFAEASFLDDDAELAVALVEHSYISSFAMRLRTDLVGMGDFNGLFLIYDFDASNSTPNEGGPMRWVRSYRYVKM